MTGWREVAAKVLATEASPSPRVPGWLISGVRSLQNTPLPGADHSAWQCCATDAVCLIEEGWAERALKLGWHELELVGCSRDGGAAFEGLAVWLRGDRLIILDNRSAIAARGRLRRVFNRRAGFLGEIGSASEVIPVWDLGR